MKDNSKNIIVGILIIVIVVLVGLLIMNLNKKDKKPVDNPNDQVENTNNDKTEDYVYQANYKYDNKYQKYGEDNESQTVYDYDDNEFEYAYGVLSELKVPYINIDSDDAKSANKEIENLYITHAKKFDEYAKEYFKDTEALYNKQVLTYRTYKYNDILSVVVISGEQYSSPIVLEYKTYNFDVKTGKQLNHKELATKLGYTEVLPNAKKALENKMNELYKDDDVDLTKDCSSNNKAKSCYVIADEMLENDFNNNKTLAFTDNNGTLNILAIPYYEGIQNGEENKYAIKIAK